MTRIRRDKSGAHHPSEVAAVNWPVSGGDRDRDIRALSHNGRIHRTRQVRQPAGSAPPSIDCP
jgi:hypothetical protein